ncbi:OmpW family outer membrane protein [Marinomonas transparens]|uniref:Outer membrane beta-barrel protein n=1 Tax=Marinomonas transparens TaxID=2795388 RepID=A0A934N5Q7_9GAMM|nr:OmpW family outer membrane protein [Marinomonas transparens]MBJ7537296.1 outer membrane beta-barrel protein [Marinomonas transparens]
MLSRSSSLLTVGLLSSAMFMSANAIAHNADDFFVRGGLAYVAPNESSDVVLGDSELEINNVLKIGATLTYMKSDNVGFEVLLGLPFTHEVSLKTSGHVANVSHLPLSVVAQYYFADSDSDIRPYVGGGFNYTTFLDEEGVGALASADVSVDNSFGYAIQAGIDIDLNDKWFANTSIWYLDIDTDVHVNNFPVNVPPIKTTINPLAFLVSVGYTF